MSRNLKAEFSNLNISQFPLTTRALNCLKEAGFNCVQDFKGAKEADVKAIRGLGAAQLAELKLFLKSQGVVLERKKREGPKYHPRAKELVVKMLPKGEFSFAVEIPAAHKLIEAYGFDSVARFKLPEHVNSLRYMLSGMGGWLDRKLAESAPMTLVERIEEKVDKVEEVGEIIEYKPAARPMDLKSFLGLR